MKLFEPFTTTGGYWQIIQRFAENNFAPRNPYAPWPAHQGIDWSLARGRWLFSTHNGVVTFAGEDPRSAGGVEAGYGWYVEIQDGQNLRSRTCHLIPNSIPTGVKVGSWLTGRTYLGACNSTGFSTIDHTHIEWHSKAEVLYVPGYVGSDGWGRFDALPYLPVLVGGQGKELLFTVQITPEAEKQSMLLDIGAAIWVMNSLPGDLLSIEVRNERQRINEDYKGRVTARPRGN